MAKNNRFLLNSENCKYRDVFSQIADALQQPQPKYFASNLILELVWRAAKTAGKFTGKSPLITRETAANASRIRNFDGSKITRMFGFGYLPVKAAIKETAACFLQEQKRH
jgi:uncharacterized protein (DUF952 family)